jgi:hypothetical protein
VDHDQRQRRFQFSLRKLLLWMAVLAVYLGVLQWMGWVTPLTAGFSLSLGVIAVFVVNSFRTTLMAVISWGVTGICLIVVFRFSKGIPWEAWWLCVVQPEILEVPSLAQPPGQFVIGFAYGAMLGIVTCVPVRLVVWFVNKIDSLLQSNTPKDAAKHSNKPPHRNAPSSDD